MTFRTSYGVPGGSGTVFAHAFDRSVTLKPDGTTAVTAPTPDAANFIPSTTPEGYKSFVNDFTQYCVKLTPTGTFSNVDGTWQKIANALKNRLTSQSTANLHVDLQPLHGRVQPPDILMWRSGMPLNFRDDCP